jgi:hypothetical protein
MCVKAIGDTIGIIRDIESQDLITGFIQKKKKGSSKHFAKKTGNHKGVEPT